MRGSPLISVEELADALADPDRARRPTVLDVRWDLGQGPRPDRYAAAHIPGAAFVDLDRALAAPVGDGRRGRHPLPDPDTFVTAMRAAGVDSARPVVVYDDAGGTIAARAWWLLRHHGHRDVALLDGGLPAWTAAGRPTESGVPDAAARAPGDFDGTPGHMPTLDADQAAALAADPSGALLDARQADRYRGESEPIDPRAGHIPGARHRSTRDNLDSEGRFLAPRALAEAFAAVGARIGARVGAYCGSGVTAAHEVLALELAGIDAALYPGSWSEWSSDPIRPVQTGDEAGPVAR
ncbi:MAG TPA: sulfurtransferase [Solirubrobacteraceae bacterium]|nr:sulfurtransferase [Solirubrobacteraceae bacterium]